MASGLPPEILLAIVKRVKRHETIHGRLCESSAQEDQGQLCRMLTVSRVRSDVLYDTQTPDIIDVS